MEKKKKREQKPKISLVHISYSRSTSAERCGAESKPKSHQTETPFNLQVPMTFDLDSPPPPKGMPASLATLLACLLEICATPVRSQSKVRWI